MTAKVQFVGGHSNKDRHSAVQSAAFGYVVATGAAEAVGILPSTGLRMSFGMVNMGTFFQAEVPVTVSFTLSPDPHSEDAIWGSPLAITPTNIFQTPLAYTGLKVEFGEAGGSVFIGCL